MKKSQTPAQSNRMGKEAIGLVVRTGICGGLTLTIQLPEGSTVQQTTETTTAAATPTEPAATA